MTYFAIRSQLLSAAGHPAHAPGHLSSGQDQDLLVPKRHLLMLALNHERKVRVIFLLLRSISADRSIACFSSGYLFAALCDRISPSDIVRRPPPTSSILSSRMLGPAARTDRTSGNQFRLFSTHVLASSVGLFHNIGTGRIDTFLSAAAAFHGHFRQDGLLFIIPCRSLTQHIFLFCSHMLIPINAAGRNT